MNNMNELFFKVHRANDNIKMITKREEDSGYDIYTTQEEDVFLMPNENFKFATGLYVEVPNGYGFFMGKRQCR